MRKATSFDVLPAVPSSLCCTVKAGWEKRQGRVEKGWVAGWVFLEGTCRGQWERHGRLLAPDLPHHLDGTALRKATAFDVFPSSSLIFVLYCESWVREEAGES